MFKCFQILICRKKLIDVDSTTRKYRGVDLIKDIDVMYIREFMNSAKF